MIQRGFKETHIRCSCGAVLLSRSMTAKSRHRSMGHTLKNRHIEWDG